MEGLQSGGKHLNKPVITKVKVKVLRKQGLFTLEKTMIITQRLSDEELIRGIYNAAQEYKMLIGKSYLIIGKNKKSPYFWFECRFEKKQFMHLLGIKSVSLSADQFFDKCDEYNCGIGSGITISECTPSRNHNRLTINQKCSCAKDMLHIIDAKYMKVGIKDKISRYVDFNYAYGSEAVLGFRKEYNNPSFPVTLIPKSIDEFSSDKYRVMFVLEKNIDEELYRKVIVEIKKGIFVEHIDGFPDDLAKKIEAKNL